MLRRRGVMKQVVFKGLVVREDGVVSNAFGVAVDVVKRCTGGYPYISVPGERFPVRRNRFVYEAFYGPIADGMQIDHADANRDNDAISNLSAVTAQENSLAAWQSTPNRTARRGGVIQYDISGAEIARYKSLAEAGRAVGGDGRRIGEVARGEKDTHRGFKWVYIGDEK